LSIDPTKIRLKPTYNASNPIEPTTLEIGVEDDNLQSIVPSTADFGQVLTPSGNVPISDSSVIISDVDAIGLVNPGDDTDYDQTYEWLPPESSIIYQIDMSFAVGLNLSAFTSGSATIDSVQVIITQQDEQTPRVLLDELFLAVGLTALVATGAQILLLDMQRVIDDKKIKGGVPITIQIIINTTQSMVQTRQVGIIPFVSYHSEAIAKRFTTSVIKFYNKPSLDSAFLVLRTEDAQELLDYSGVPFGG